jgi:integrase
MNALDEILRDYLALRRALGFKFERAQHLLPDFVAFVQQSDSHVITTPLALVWATRSKRASGRWWTVRLSLVRGFARFAHTRDPRTEIPAPDLLPSVKQRARPHIYSDEQVQALLAATARIENPFRAHTYRTLIGLLASTGIRVGEAIALDRNDLDLDQAVLTIRDGKFGKAREVPLHATTVDALEGYARSRTRRFRRATSAAFLASLSGTRLFYKNVHFAFLRLLAWAGLADLCPRPRIHDLRHTFAVRTLIDWYESGVDIETRLPVLSTFLGHVNPSTTYWYLSAIPELMETAMRRLEASLGELP